MKRVLVTGASGFVGSHLVEALRARGGEYEVFATSARPSPWLESQLGAENVFALDLTQEDAVNTLVQKVQPNWVFHLAALAAVGESFQNALEVLENNTRVQLLMLEAVRQFSPQARVLCVGSATEYGPLPGESGENLLETAPLFPSNPYAVSKMTQDYLSLSYFLAYKTDVIRVRPFNQIGPRQTHQFAVASFAKQIVQIEQGKQEKLLVGNLDAIRDFTDVRDAARAYILLMQHGQSGEVYNVGSGQGVEVRELLDQLRDQAKTAIMVEQDPSRLRPVDVPVFTANIARLQSLGWQPEIPLSQTLADILEYERKQQ